MKILILGAKGNLGGQLIKAFKKENEVIGWDRGDLDITDKSLVLEKISELKPDVILNTASYNALDKIEESKEEFEKAKKINGQAVGYLSDSALKIGAILVHFSTDYVFDGEKKEGYRENDEPKAINRYAETKVMGEKELMTRKGEGLKWYLVRTSKLFGLQGESDNSKKSFFDLILGLSKERKEFKMVHEEEISLFTYTVDLARDVKDLLRGDYQYGIYHITNTEPASWYDGAKYLFELKNITDVKLIPSKTKDYQRPAKRPKYSILLNTKLPKMRSWKEALGEYLDK